jgi:hypothetical protein
MQNQKKTDFSVVLTAIHDAGINDYQLSRDTGINRVRLTQWRTGTRKTVDYDSGLLIMAVYKTGLTFD